MNTKINVGIIGTGNIGTDLLYKVIKSKNLSCSIFAGRNPDSKGIELAKSMGITTSIESIHYIEEHPNCCDIVFDATSAQVFLHNAPILEKLGVFVINLTPAKVGEYCVPVINMNELLLQKKANMVTCGGQATIPIAYALTRVHQNIQYLEIVSSIASKSAGLGTRNNIDEFTQTTSDALKQFTKINKTKAIIVLNPAEPPVNMRSTVYAVIDNPDMQRITEEVKSMEVNLQKYIPGYKIITGPIYENGRITIIIEVTGSGDYLPKYSGNLDIITCAAIRLAEEYAKNIN